MTSDADFHMALAQLIHDPDAEIGDGATEREIEEAESRLVGRFPETYKSFLRQVGWGGRGHWEIAGLGRNVPFHLDIVRLTLVERRDSNLPSHLAPVYNDGGASLYCVSLRPERDSDMVVIWDLESPVVEAAVAHSPFPDWSVGLMQQEG